MFVKQIFPFLILVEVFFTYRGWASTKDLQKIEMFVGDIKEINCYECREVQLSRKGVLEIVSHQDNEYLSLVALRSGIVLMSVSPHKKNFVVYVREKESKKSTKTSILIEENRKRSENLKAYGSIDSYKLGYWLQVYAMAIEDTFAANRSPFEESDLAFYRMKDIWQLHREMGAKAEIVARPSLRLQMDKTFQITSGGEVSIPQGMNSFANEVWKSYGFDMIVTAQDLSSCAVGLDFVIHLSRPIHQRGQRFKNNKIQGYTELRCDQEELVAIVHFENNEEKKETKSFLGMIPILGPLFSGDSVNNGAVYLVVYMKIFPFTSGEDQQNSDDKKVQQSQ